jgi:DNA-binding CsgD family transcriptional regulator
VTAPAPARVLTRRQLEVLRLAANGNTSAEIGQRLFVTRDTVNGVLRYAYRALGVTDRAHAVAVALRLGLIGLDEIRLPEPLAPSRALAASVAAELRSGARGEPGGVQRGAGGHGAERAGFAGEVRR